MKPRNIQPGQSPPAMDVNDARHRYLYLRVGEVVRADERGFVDVVWLTGEGSRSVVPITPPVCGPRSFLGGVPEEGALVVCDFKRSSPDGRQANPVIIGSPQSAPLPSMRHDVRQDVDVSDWDEEDQARLSQYLKKQRLRRRKGYPGDIIGGSSTGSDLVLDEDARLEDSFGDEVRLRASDGALTMASVQRFEATAGSMRRAGPVQRNALLMADDDVLPPYLMDGEDPVAEVNDSRTTGFQVLSDGRRVLYVTTARGSAPGDSPTLMESRLEVRRTGSPILPVRGDIAPAEGEDLDPDIEEVHGVVVGNSVKTEADRRCYARPLRPSLWKGAPSLGTARPSLDPVEVADGAEGDVLARSASYLYRMKTSADEVFVAQDGEGKRFIHLPRPGDGPGAEGRSLDADLGGGIALTVGADSAGRSIGLVTAGDVEVRAGRGGQGRPSVSLSGASGVRLDGGAGRDGTAVEIRGRGGVKMSSSADTTISSDGSLSMSARAAQESYSRRSVLTIEDDVRSVGGNSYDLVGQKVKEVVGATRETTVAQGDTLSVILGNREVTVTAGSHETTVVAGDHRESVVTGSWKSTVGAGSWESTVGTGNVVLSTGSGSVMISTGVGALALSCSSAASMTAGVSAAINAPSVVLGPPALVTGGAVIGGLPGVGPHLDYVTGLPLRGSTIVRVAG